MEKLGSQLYREIGRTHLRDRYPNYDGCCVIDSSDLRMKSPDKDVLLTLLIFAYNMRLCILTMAGVDTVQSILRPGDCRTSPQKVFWYGLLWVNLRENKLFLPHSGHEGNGGGL